MLFIFAKPLSSTFPEFELVKMKSEIRSERESISLAGICVLIKRGGGRLWGSASHLYLDFPKQGLLLESSSRASSDLLLHDPQAWKSPVCLQRSATPHCNNPKAPPEGEEGN